MEGQVLEGEGIEVRGRDNPGLGRVFPVELVDRILGEDVGVFHPLVM